MKISIIAACDKNRLIGVDGKMPWQNDPAMKEDLKRFKKITMGHAVVMGTRTKTSLGDIFPMPGRKNIVLSTKEKQGVYQSPCKGFYQSTDIESVLAYLKIGGVKECFFMGGQEVFKQGLKYADTVYLTEIDGEYNGIDQNSKRYFPVMDKNEWQLVRAERIRDVPCSFLVYRKVV